MMENSTEIVLPLYNCHKNVRAVKIGAISGDNGEGRFLITPENPAYRTFAVSSKYINKHQPHDGGYYVQYEDGYESFSPADVFEAGYTLLKDESESPEKETGTGCGQKNTAGGTDPSCVPCALNPDERMMHLADLPVGLFLTTTHAVYKYRKKDGWVKMAMVSERPF